MEKNGAISNQTPHCCGGNCHSKQADDQQGIQFPQTEREADALEEDLTKRAVDTVASQSRPTDSPQ